MFTKDSILVQNYILLIEKGLKTIGEVPEFQNLREVVLDALAN